MSRRASANRRPVGPRAGPAAAPRLVVAAVVLVASAVLLFARLGHYAFWDDEAGLALVAQGVWRTGDTTAVIDHNIVAPEQGHLLRNLHDRANPPLPAYLVAPFIGLGGTPWWGRAPIALSGLVCIAWILWWLWKEGADTTTWILMAIGILGNVSLFLYFRQCRYYGLVILLAVGVARLYLGHDGSRWASLGIAGLLLGLLASHYMTYAAVLACLLVDYMVWGRRRRALSLADWAWLLGPQVAVGALIVAIWNPFVTDAGRFMFSSDAFDRLTLFYRSLRDMNRAEFGVGLLLLLAPVAYVLDRRSVVLRGLAALVVYVAVMSAVSPMKIRAATFADVRYLVPLIPLCILLGVLTLRILTRRLAWAAIPLAVVAFGTNLLHGGMFQVEGLQSTPLLYLRELRHPPDDPYALTAAWIRRHVAERASIWVMPSFMMYPLMYHAPAQVYGWQLRWPPAPQFAHRPPIDFWGYTPPDFIVAFGPVVREVGRSLQSWPVRYEQVATIDHFWRAVHRPELFWRSFTPMTNYDRTVDAIYVLKRIGPPPRLANPAPSR